MSLFLRLQLVHINLFFFMKLLYIEVLLRSHPLMSFRFPMKTPPPRGASTIKGIGVFVFLYIYFKI